MGSRLHSSTPAAEIKAVRHSEALPRVSDDQQRHRHGAFAQGSTGTPRVDIGGKTTYGAEDTTDIRIIRAHRTPCTTCGGTHCSTVSQ